MASKVLEIISISETHFHMTKCLVNAFGDNAAYGFKLETVSLSVVFYSALKFKDVVGHI